MAGFGFSADDGTWQPAEVIGEVVYWLATSPEANAYNGECVQRRGVHQRKLLAGWNPKVALDGPIIRPGEGNMTKRPSVAVWRSAFRLRSHPRFAFSVVYA